MDSEPPALIRNKFISGIPTSEVPGVWVHASGALVMGVYTPASGGLSEAEVQALIDASLSGYITSAAVAAGYVPLAGGVTLSGDLTFVAFKGIKLTNELGMATYSIIGGEDHIAFSKKLVIEGGPHITAVDSDTYKLVANALGTEANWEIDNLSLVNSAEISGNPRFLGTTKWQAYSEPSVSDTTFDGNTLTVNYGSLVLDNTAGSTVISGTTGVYVFSGLGLNVKNAAGTATGPLTAGAGAFDSLTVGGTAVSLSGHSHAFNTLTGTPTTLAGYGITDAQGLDATLTALAGVTTAANKLIYATGSDTFSTTDFSAFGRTLIDDADASAARTTLGLGTMATQASTSYLALSGGTLTGGLTGTTATWSGLSKSSTGFIVGTPTSLDSGKVLQLEKDFGTAGGSGMKLRNTNASGYTEVVLNNDNNRSDGCFVFGLGGSTAIGVPNESYFANRIGGVQFWTTGTARMTVAATTGNVVVTTGSFTIATSSTPASASATGTTGTIAWDASYIYVCTATNTWKRAAIATW